MPAYTYDTIATGTLNMLECARQIVPNCRFYQASSSEMFGKSPGPQNELTRFQPCSPYGCAKVAAYHQVVNYRESHSMFATNGILFNHESPRRTPTFVTRKITHAAARIAAGLQDTLYLGNLDAVRDWGFAGDYVEAMWLMLQHDRPDDFVIGTGESHSVQEWLATVFDAASLDISSHVKFDERLLRASEVDFLQADASKARAVLGWEPRIRFNDLAAMMLEADQASLCAACGH
jgi:GDPmannose 4,6-dehydratase